MERNDVVHISQLKFGDRFYKLNDRNKTVHTKVQHKARKTTYYLYTQFAAIIGSTIPEMMKDNTWVVFLRHGTDLEIEHAKTAFYEKKKNTAR